MEQKRRHTMQNSLFALKTVFRYAPATATVYALLALTSSVFTVVQILFLEKLVNFVTAYILQTADVRPVLLWGLLYVFSLLGV